jgi:eukaryotic-like serine/threonine-protein kinase
MVTPAEMLEGQVLDNNWIVGRLIPRTESQTGGTFSSSYEVRNGDGRIAFLKAMDYTKALAEPDPAAALNLLTSAFLFEREVLQECGERKMSRIVRAIDGGKILISNAVTEYLIFEKAEGDIRTHLDSTPEFDLAWTMTCIHNICVGMQQLNGASIAHQDLKPSNVLHFREHGEKIADLGRAWHGTRVSPHDRMQCAGDLTYAPPELLYGYTDPNESDRRFGADFYLVGSMILFLFTGARASQLLLSELDQSHYPGNWQGTYEEALPYLQHAFNKNISTIFEYFADPILGSEIVEVMKQMCDPNIATRGDKYHKSKYGSRFGLQRFVSAFDRLRTAAILGRIKHR